ncbi:beta-lactamase-like protein [Thelephora terrestris]|uniref:Beta-lactamase-like protein n=1 Tax=Thelephora terrestris TaxID=56493 RepID=A0A9P6HD89_9AGAM|nr:beta-lactamase-like protein [Thelephora terrestris]
MPPGAPYRGFILPYSIRVDEFTGLPSDYPVVPKLHLLTHTHTDHLNGLSSKSFGYTVVCSEDAKQMLLRHEVFDERSLFEHGIRAEKRRTFKHLKVSPLKRKDGTLEHGGRDLLQTIPLRTPTEFNLNGEDVVTITAMDANHCPGAVMYLVQGSQGSILHTGDVRAEPSFLESVAKDPFLKPFLVQGGTRTLDAIYLDTASVWSSAEPPSKRVATDGLVDLMGRFPATTHFFVNAWTWGYEEMLTAIASHFGDKIHVDRYKHSIYSHLSHEGLLRITTREMSSTRFHACERFDRCEVVERSAKTVVYVNPVPMGSGDWSRYLDATREKLHYGEDVTSLLCPLWRHSPSSELQAFVKLFRPHRIIPNTLDQGLENLDWIAIDNMFRDCLSSHGKSITESILEDVMKNISEGDLSVKLDSWAELAGDGEKGDVALKNLEGGGEAIGTATQWMTPDEKGLKKLQRIQEHLPESLKLRLVNYIAWAKAKIQALAEERLREESQTRSERSEETEDDFYDDKGNTAHRIFAGSSFTRSERSFSAPVEGESGFFTPVSSPRKVQHHRQILTASPTPPSSIFNQGYASWFTPITPPKRLSNPPLKTPKLKKVTSILSPSTTKVNAVRPSATTKSRLEATSDPTSRSLPPSNLAPAHSSATPHNGVARLPHRPEPSPEEKNGGLKGRRGAESL